MSLVTIGLIGICLLFILIFLGMPIGFPMILIGIGGMCIVRGFDAGLYNLALIPFSWSSQYVMSAIPLFILMGFLAANTGLAQDAFFVANKWVGHRRGGLAVSTIAACTVFGAVCGSVIAAAATMSMAALPEMRRYKYSNALALGCIAAGGNLSFLIPPSLGFIVYAILTELSIGALFISGILPGILLAVLFGITIMIICRIDPGQAPAGPKVGWIERLVSLKRIWAFTLVILLVLGGIYGGIFTPTEAGAAGIFGVLVLGLIKRQMKWSGLNYSLIETAKLTGMIFFLIISAQIFNSFLAITEIPLALANTISQLTVPAIFILFAVLAFYIFIGFVMEVIPIMLLVVPITHPILVELGFDPLWLGVLTILTIIMGQISPPFGMVVFTLAGVVKDVPLFTIFRGALPFLGAMFIGLVILIIFPEISTFLPHLMK